MLGSHFKNIKVINEVKQKCFSVKFCWRCTFVDLQKKFLCLLPLINGVLKENTNKNRFIGSFWCKNNVISLRHLFFSFTSFNLNLHKGVQKVEENVSFFDWNFTNWMPSKLIWQNEGNFHVNYKFCITVKLWRGLLVFCNFLQFSIIWAKTVVK